MLPSSCSCIYQMRLSLIHLHAWLIWLSVVCTSTFTDLMYKNSQHGSLPQPFLSPDGLPLSGARERRDHLLWDQSDCPRHPRLLCKLIFSETEVYKSPQTGTFKYIFFYFRLNFMTSSARIWRKWPIQKERRSLQCTEAEGEATIWSAVLIIWVTAFTHHVHVNHLKYTK